MAAIQADRVFRKTPKGQQEIDQRSAGLGLRQRRVLILVNGERSAADIAADVGDNGEAMLAELLAGGFIEPASGEGAASIPATGAAAPAAASAAPFDLKAAQRRAVKAIEELLGPEGEPLALKIERTKSEAELLAIVEKTRDLIRGSRGETRAQKVWSAVFP